jgi:membrane protein YdbS with pleckstrin-like domain
MRTLTSDQSRIAMLAVWLVVFLILTLVWFMIGPQDQWWAVAIYAAVLGVATFLTIKISPYQTPDDNVGQDFEQRI